MKIGLFRRLVVNVLADTLLHGDVISVMRRGRKEKFIFIRIWGSDGNKFEGRKLEMFRDGKYHVSGITMIIELGNDAKELTLIGRTRVKSIVTKVVMYKKPKTVCSFRVNDIIDINGWPCCIKAEGKEGGALVRALVRDGKKGFRYSVNGNIWHSETDGVHSFKKLGWVKRSHYYVL